MTRLSGQVTLSDSPIQGVPVAVIDTNNSEDPTNWSIVATDVTDANGDWQVTGLSPNAVERYHALVQYDDGGQLYNVESLPYLSTDAYLSAPVQTWEWDGPTATISAATAIPDSGMFQSPIYQWSVTQLSGVNDGDIIDFPEVLGGLSDATAVNDPVYRSDQGGYPAVEYGGSNDGHDWSPDSQFPTGTEPFSVAVTMWLQGSDEETMYNVGNITTNAGNAIALSVRSGNLEWVGEGDNLVGSSIPTGQLVTVGARSDGSNRKIYNNGSPDGNDSVSVNLDSVAHALGYRRGRDTGYLDGFLIDVIVCDVSESDQAFSDYHDDRV